MMQTAPFDTTASIAPAQGRHIAVVTETYPPEINGVANTVHHFVSGLLERGHRISLVRPGHAGANDLPATDPVDVSLTPGLPLPGYPGLKFGLPAGRMLSRRWKTDRPDAVYIATEGPLGWSALRIASRYRIPVVSGFHTNFHSYSRHYYLGLMHEPVLNYLKHFHNRTTVTIVPTYELKSQLEDMGFGHIEVVARGVDTQLFRPERRSDTLRRAWELKPTDIAVLYVGRIAAEKNLPLAVRGFRSLESKGLSLRFIIVGDGPMRRPLSESNPDFIFTGMKTGIELAEHYASGDILLFPSETETFGNVILEAMASGLAVTAYDYAAAASHIQDGVTGMLARLGDEDDFIAAARRPLDAGDRLTELRANAYRHAVKHDWPSTIDRLERLLISPNGKGRDS